MPFPLQRWRGKLPCDYRATRFEDTVTGLDVVVDTVGRDTQQHFLGVLKPGGILVSVVSKIPEKAQQQSSVKAGFFYVEVTTGRLTKITEPLTKES